MSKSLFWIADWPYLLGEVGDGVDPDAWKLVAMISSALQSVQPCG